MRALHKKLVRDLWRLWGPALAAALVIATGITAFLSMRGAWVSLDRARTGYFERAHFAHIIASAGSAPERLAEDALRIPGVEAVEPRVSAGIALDVPGLDESARAMLVSTRKAGLNRLTVRQGDAPLAPFEVVVSDAFAAVHGMAPGTRLLATVAGRRVELLVVGIGSSPDFLYVVPPASAWPDDERFGVLWMEHDAAAALLGQRGAFTELLVKLQDAGDQTDTLERDVIAALDLLLAPWGAPGARGRNDQIAWRFVSEELRQLDTQTFAVPLIFLGIAALLLNMVLARLVDTQREQIALLKAVGYTSGAVALHYVQLALCIVLPGAALGIAGGVAAGRALMDVYLRYFRFDVLELELPPSLVLVALAMSFGAAVVGAGAAARRAALMEPAVAMQPPAPPTFARGNLERLRLMALLPPSARMVVRQTTRRPVRTALTVLGVAFSVAIVVIASVMDDSLRTAIDLFFQQSSREDIEVSLFSPRSRTALHSELAAEPGVLQVEPLRMVPVRLFGPGGTWLGALEGRSPGGTLRVALDLEARALPPPPDDGVVLTDELAARLQLRPGDAVQLERIDGDRRRVDTWVAGLSSDMLGLHCTASLPGAMRMFGDGDAVTGALLQVDGEHVGEVARTLKTRANVASVAVRLAALAAFNRMMAESFSITRVVLALLASLLSVGIVYNNARIALAERARELATLRVLGMTTGEVSRIFLGEQLLLVLLALPLGWAIGRGLAQALLSSTSMSDLFRLPIVTQPSTYLFATGVVLGASVFTALLARRRLDHLDLVAVLKARE